MFKPADAAVADGRGGQHARARLGSTRKILSWPAAPSAWCCRQRSARPGPWSQLSSSAGIKPGLRVHLWYWLDRPVSDAEAKRWLKGAPVDLSIYQPVGITTSPRRSSTASTIPASMAGWPCCPVTPRSRCRTCRIRSGRGRRSRRPSFAAYAPPLRGLSFKATRSEKYMLKCLRGVAEAPAGARHPTIVRVAACLYGLAKAGALDPRDVEARILGAAVINGLGREDPEEVNAALRWAWEQRPALEIAVSDYQPGAAPPAADPLGRSRRGGAARRGWPRRAR